MNLYKIYINSDHTKKDEDTAFVSAFGNGTTVVQLVAPFATTHTEYALFKKPNGLSPERYLMADTGQTEIVDNNGQDEEWNIWQLVIPSPVFDIDSAVSQNVLGQFEDWYFVPEDGFAGIKQYATQLFDFTDVLDGDFARVVDTNTDWQFEETVNATSIEIGSVCKITTVGTTDFTLIGAASNTVGTIFTATAVGTGTGIVDNWLDTDTTLVGSESRTPTETYNINVDPSIDTSLPTIAPDNTELIINVLNNKASLTFVADNYINQDFSLYTLDTNTTATYKVALNDDSGNVVYATIGSLLGAIDAMSKSIYDTNSNGIVDKAEALDDGTGTRTIADDGTNWLSNAPIKADTFKVGTKEITDNLTDSTIDVKLNDEVTGQLFEESLKYVYNDTGAKLENAKVVYLTGADTGRTTCGLANNNIASEALNTIAVTTQEIENATQGFITQRGEVRDFDTTGTAEGEVWAVEDSLYLGTNGNMTNVMPESPLYAIKIGQVLVVSATVGKIDVNIRVVPVFGEQYPVKVTNPQVGETMVYNGVEFANAETQTVGAGKSVSFYIEDVIELGSYELLSPVPLGLAEELDTASLTPQNTDVLISGYITEELGRTTLQAGTWVFDNFLRVNTTNGTTIAKIKVYQYEVDTTETLLFEVATGDINTTTLENFQISTTQTEFTINSTDRLLIKYYGRTTSTNTPVITLAHSGTENASKVLTPLQTVHNDLAELQGGNGTERYHLSAAELTRLNSEVVRTDLTNYTEDLALTGSEKFYMEDGTTKKRTTANGLATYIGSLSGSVINRGKYYSTGLGAHDTAFIRTFTLLNTTNADLYYDLVDLTEIPNFYTVDGIGYVIRVKIPSSMADDSALMRISLDNGDTYKNVLFNGVGIVGSNLLGEEIDFKLTANGFEQLTEADLSNSIPYTGAIGQHTLGANGIEHPITYKAITPFDEVQGRTLQVIQADEDVIDTGTIAFTSVLGVDYYDTLNEAIVAGTGSTLTFTNSSGATSDMMAVVVPSDITTVAGMKAVLDGTYLATGVHTVGEARTYVQADYDSGMQEYIERDGTANGDTITGIYGRTVGKNKIDINSTLISRSGYNNSDVSIDGNRLVVENVTDNIVMILTKVLPNTSYYIKSNDNSLTTTGRIRVYEYTELPANTLDGTLKINGLSETDGGTFTTGTSAKYIGVGLYLNSLAINDYLGEIQLELGSTATDYEAYEERYTHTKSAMYGIGGVYDTLDTKRFGVETGVSGTATVNTTLIPTMNATNDFIAYDEVTGDSVLGSYGDTLTFSNTATIIYELATYTEQDIEVDGMNIVSPYSTFEQYGGGIVPKFYTTSAYSLQAMSDIQTGALIKHDKELDEHEGEIEVLKENVSDNTKISILSSSVAISDSLTLTSNITLDEDIDNYEWLYLTVQRSDQIYELTPIKISSLTIGNTVHFRIEGEVGQTNDVYYKFRFYRNSTKVFSAFYYRQLTNTTTPTFSNLAASAGTILDIRVSNN